MIKRTKFNSHKNHNPSYDILEGHIDADSFITYALCISGENKGKELMEFYTGENFVVGSKKKSYSRVYSPDKIPAKYKTDWLALKSMYNKEHAEKMAKGGNVSGKFVITSKDQPGGLFIGQSKGGKKIQWVEEWKKPLMFNSKESAQAFLDKLDGFKGVVQNKIASSKMAKGGSVDDGDVDEFVNGYKRTLLFATSDPDTDESFDEKYNLTDFAPETDKKLKKMASEYISENKQAIEDSGMDLSSIGGDVFYTQAGHGAGFFDHSLDKDVEDKLTSGAEKYGDLIDIEAGDDGLIRIRGGRRGFFEDGGNIMKKGGSVESRISVLEKAMNSPMASEAAKKAFKGAIDKLKNSKAEGGPVSPTGDQPTWDDGDKVEVFPGDESFYGEGGTVKGAERNKLIYKYVIDAIDGSGYDEDPKTDAEKIKFLWKTFISEYGWAVKQMGPQRAFCEWLQGLPSSFNVDYENYRIIEIGKEWGILAADASESKEDKFIETWWARVYMGVRAAARKNKVELSTADIKAKGGKVDKYEVPYNKSAAVIKVKKGNKVKTREGNIETVSKINSNGNIETVENDYSWPPYAVELVSVKEKGGQIGAGDQVNITDSKSLYKGKSGYIVGEHGKKSWTVKVLVDGKETNCVVSKSGAKLVMAEGGYPGYERGKNYPVKAVSERVYSNENLSDFPNFSATGSVSGMKKQYYGKDALLVKYKGYIYNVTSKPEIYFNN